MIEETTTKTIACKYCVSTAVVRFGTYKGNQRYWCKSCNRKFKADADSFHGKVPSEYVSSAMYMYFKGLSYKDISEYLIQEHGYYPSKSVIFKWINKYTDLARKQFQNVRPDVGDTWVAYETMLNFDGQHKVWFYDIIDEKTRFLLASRVTLSRTTKDVEMLMKDAEKVAGKKPRKVLTDSKHSCLESIGQAYGADTKHIQSYPTAKENDIQRIKRFHETSKDRTKIFKAFRNVETMIQFTDGWLVYYNYFKPHESLDGRTPAEEAHVKYDIHNWEDLARVPISKEAEIKSHTIPEET
jgi:putative transposase